MEQVLDISPGLDDFLRRVKKIEIEELKMPEFYISGWPSRVDGVEITVRGLGFYFRVQAINDNLFKLYRSLCLGIVGYRLGINGDGTIVIRTSSNYCYRSKKLGCVSTDKGERINALVLFNQLKDRGLPKIIKKVERDARYNSEVVEAVKKALEPFIPQIVADKLVS